MSSRIRQSLVLTTLLALLLALAGAAARSSLAANPPNTTIAGIDVDATTIPQLEQLMNSRRLNAVDLMNFYLRRIRQLNPTLHAVITVSPTALADATAITVRCSGCPSSSRTTSTPPAYRRRPGPGRSPGAPPATRSSCSG